MDDTYASTFDEIGDHHDDRDLLLPHHAPESVESRGQRTLGADVSSCTLPSVDVIRVHVIVALFGGATAAGQQLDSGMVVCGGKEESYRNASRVSSRYR